MTNIKNAMDYHNELSKLKALIESIEYTLGYVEGSLTHVDDPASIVAMSLSLAQADLNKSLIEHKARHAHIVNKLSSSYF